MAARRALIVDNNTSLAETVAEVLTDDGFEVDVVSSGADALAAWRSHPADLVVVDVNLPDIGGLTIARRLSRRGGGCGLVVMSASDPEQVIPQCEDIGAVFLAKPFGPVHLMTAVRLLLEQSLRAKASTAASHRLLGPRKPRGLLQHSRQR